MLHCFSLSAFTCCSLLVCLTCWATASASQPCTHHVKSSRSAALLHMRCLLYLGTSIVSREWYGHPGPPSGHIWLAQLFPWCTIFLPPLRPSLCRSPCSLIFCVTLFSFAPVIQSCSGMATSKASGASSWAPHPARASALLFPGWPFWPLTHWKAVCTRRAKVAATIALVRFGFF